MSRLLERARLSAGWTFRLSFALLLAGSFCIEGMAQHSGEGTELSAHEQRSLNQARMLADGLIRRGDDEGALEQLRQALWFVERSSSRLHPEAVRLRGELAGVYLRKDDLGTAAALYREAVELAKSAFGPSHLEVAALRSAYGDALYRQKRFPQAQAQHEEALSIHRAVSGEDGLGVAAAFNDLAAVHAKQSHLALALALGIRAVELFQKHADAADPGSFAQAEEVAVELLGLAQRNVEAGSQNLLEQTRRHLAGIHQTRNAPGKAIPLITQILKDKQEVLGEADPEVIQLMIDLGRLYRANEEEGRAEDMLLKVITILRREYGPDHAEVIPPMMALANLHVGQERFTSAELLYKQVLAIKTAQLGEADPDLASIHIQLADLYALQQNQASAEEHYRRAIQILSSAYGEEHEEVARAIVKLAQFLSNSGNLRSAAAWYRRARAIKEALLGADHPEIADLLQLEADMELAMDHPIAARALYQRALDIRLAAFGKGSSEVVESLVLLGTVQEALGEMQTAEEAYRQALQIDKGLKGPDHPDLADHLVRMANLKVVLEHRQEAEQLYQEAIALRELQLKMVNAEPSTVLLALSELYERLGTLTGSEELLGKAFDAKREVLGSDHPDVKKLAHKMQAPVQARGHRHSLAKEKRQADPSQRLTTLRPWNPRYGSPDDEPENVEEEESAGRHSGERRPADGITGERSEKNKTLQVREQARGMIEMARVFSNRAETLAAFGRYTEAEGLYLDSLQLFERAGSHPDSTYLDALRSYSQMLRAVGRNKEADELEYRARTTAAIKTESERIEDPAKAQPAEAAP